MNEKQTSIDWNFLIGWVVVGTVGYSISGCVGLMIGLPLAAFCYALGPLVLGAAIAVPGAFAGALIGLFTWEAVRLKAPDANKMMWVDMHSLGMAISWAIFALIMYINSGHFVSYAFLVPLFFWGLLSGVIHWHTLKGQIQHTPLWFALYILYSGLVGVVILAVNQFLSAASSAQAHPDEYSVIPYWAITVVILWPIAGLLYGLMTGTLLAWLLREPKQPVGSDEHVLAG